MSWSISAIGKPKAVAAKIAADHEAAGKYAEPEQTIKNKAVDTILTLVNSLPDSVAVKVMASGSQSGQFNPQTNNYDIDITNSVSLCVEPLWGFVE